LCNSPAYSQLPPSQIVPDLLERGFISHRSPPSTACSRRQASYIIGGGHWHPGSVRRQRLTKPAAPAKSGAGILPTARAWSAGSFYYLYMFEDLYSRKIVGYEVHEAESGEYAAQLLQRTQLREQCLHKPLVLHSDNGAPMKAQTMKAKLEELGVLPSYSRPRVSNDNAFVESLFRVLKYRPQWPSRGFASLDEARLWVDRFVRWY